MVVSCLVMLQNLCLLRRSQWKQQKVVKLSSAVTESVIAQEISAEAADGCELSSDVAEDVLLKRSQRKQPMIVSCPVLFQNVFVERISAAATDGCEVVE